MLEELNLWAVRGNSVEHGDSGHRKVPTNDMFTRLILVALARENCMAANEGQHT